MDGKVDKVVVLGADQDGDSRLVESAPLAIPLLDAVESALARQVKHEEDGDGVVAHQRQHVDKLALAAQVPDGKGDFGVADGNGLLHKVDAQRLDVVLVPAALDVLDHERRLANLRIAHHADLDHDVVAAVGLVARAGPVVVVRRSRRVREAAGRSRQRRGAPDGRCLAAGRVLVVPDAAGEAVVERRRLLVVVAVAVRGVGCAVEAAHDVVGALAHHTRVGVV